MIFYTATICIDEDFKPVTPEEKTRSKRSRNDTDLRVRAEKFNSEHEDEAYLFYHTVGVDMVSVGVIARSASYDRVSELVTAFMRDTYNRPVDDVSLAETTGIRLKSMITSAFRDDYIADDDEIVERFGLTNLAQSAMPGLCYAETLAEPLSAEQAAAGARAGFCAPTLVPEIGRIFACRQPPDGFRGHPVQYVVMADEDCAENTIRLLTGALVTQHRVHSRRVCSLSVSSSSEHRRSVERMAIDSVYSGMDGGTVVLNYRSEDMGDGEYASSDRLIIGSIADCIKDCSNDVLTVLVLPRNGDKLLSWFREELGSIVTVVIAEDTMDYERAADYLRRRAIEQHVAPVETLYADLKKDGLYSAAQLNESYDRWFNAGLRETVFPEYRDLTDCRRVSAADTHKGCGLDDLNEMIGLGEAKRVIHESLDYFKAQKLFADKGFEPDRPAMSMVFTGNPGTAKTSVARLTARILTENGILTDGHMVEVGRGDLVGKYVGWTAAIVKERFREAKGGVLFIDEAYSLLDDRGGSFGDEAINTIVQEMENYREDVLVIFAGYPGPMEQFLTRNPGLRSRIAFHVPFEDYDVGELCGIARVIAGKKGLTLTDDAMDRLADLFRTARRDPEFGNGRYVRNVIENAKMAHAKRLLLASDPDALTRDQVGTITGEDIPLPTPPKTPAGMRHIGFSA